VTLTAFGRYRVAGEIGDGAMGRVYRGFAPLFARPVAIKTIKSEYLTHTTRDEYLRRFRREGPAAGWLSHPNITCPALIESANKDAPSAGDVIAAVNGIRVRSYRQFTALNTVECDTVSLAAFLLRRQGSYREVVVDCKRVSAVLSSASWPGSATLRDIHSEAALQAGWSITERG